MKNDVTMNGKKGIFYLMPFVVLGLALLPLSLKLFFFNPWINEDYFALVSIVYPLYCFVVIVLVAIGLFKTFSRKNQITGKRFFIFVYAIAICAILYFISWFIGMAPTMIMM